jgi:hypothetical protein
MTVVNHVSLIVAFARIGTVIAAEAAAFLLVVAVILLARMTAGTVIMIAAPVAHAVTVPAAEMTRKNEVLS